MKFYERKGLQYTQYTFEAQSKRATTHGMSRSKIYNSWQSMKDRCYNENAVNYENYGGRGIRVCDRWVESFKNFYEDMGERPEGTTLDRINNEKDYTPENCQWSTWSIQLKNRRSYSTNARRSYCVPKEKSTQSSSINGRDSQ
jgi:hypothetical protein